MEYNLVLKNSEHMSFSGDFLFFSKSQLELVKSMFNEIGLEFKQKVEHWSNHYDEGIDEYVYLSSSKYNFLINKATFKKEEFKNYQDYVDTGDSHIQNVIIIDDNSNIIKSIQINYITFFEKEAKINIKEISINKENIEIIEPNYKEERRILNAKLKELDTKEYLTSKFK